MVASCRLALIVDAVLSALLGGTKKRSAQGIWGDHESFTERVVAILERKKEIESPDYIYLSADEDRRNIEAQIRELPPHGWR